MAIARAYELQRKKKEQEAAAQSYGARFACWGTAATPYGLTQSTHEDIDHPPQQSYAAYSFSSEDPARLGRRPPPRVDPEPKPWTLFCLDGMPSSQAEIIAPGELVSRQNLPQSSREASAPMQRSSTGRSESSNVGQSSRSHQEYPELNLNLRPRSRERSHGRAGRGPGAAFVPDEQDQDREDVCMRSCDVYNGLCDDVEDEKTRRLSEIRVPPQSHQSSIYS